MAEAAMADTIAIEPGGDGPDERPVALAPVVPLPRTPHGPGGDAVSVLEVYEAEHLDLYRFLLATVHDPGVAEDVLQDTFLRLIRECASGRPPANPRAWLYRVATNLVIGAARRTRTVTRSLPALRTDELDRRSPEAVALEVERDEEIRSALVLASQGFTAREIGTAVGRSEAAVRTLICRARLRLRGRLDVEGRGIGQGGAVG
jgi:RNA polymerase sigma-70 factor (ECF subfamily)